jgi:hypothetical protein
MKVFENKEKLMIDHEVVIKQKLDKQSKKEKEKSLKYKDIKED